MYPHELGISDALVKCNGQDLTRKGGKSKGRLVVVLPTQLGLVPGTEGHIGELRDINTDAPSFVIPTEEGDLSFPGRIVDSASLYLGVELAPKKMQSVCTDLTARVLVFGKPKLIKGPSTVAAPAPLNRGGSNRSTEADRPLAQASQDGPKAAAAITSSTGIGAAIDTALGAKRYKTMHGMSREAQPPSHASSSSVLARTNAPSSQHRRGADSDASEDGFSDRLSDGDDDDDDVVVPRKRKAERITPKKSRKPSKVDDYDEGGDSDGGCDDDGSLASGGSGLDDAFVTSQRRASSRSAAARVSYIHDSEEEKEEEEDEESDIESDFSADSADKKRSKSRAKSTPKKATTPAKAKSSAQKTPQTKTPAKTESKKAEGKKRKAVVEISDSEDEVQIVEKKKSTSSAPKQEPNKRKPQSTPTSTPSKAKQSKSSKIESDGESSEEEEFEPAAKKKRKASPARATTPSNSHRPQRNNKRISYSQDSSGDNDDEESEYSDE